MAMHTKDLLAAELRKAGLTAMAWKAESGYYHDFLSPLDAPSMQLADDLQTYVNAPSWPRKDEAKALLDRHINGEFDASRDESEAWATSKEGQETFAKLTQRAPAAAKPKELIGRLAMRHEGELWNAYYAQPGTMHGALLLGSMRMQLTRNDERKQAFMDLMRECLADVIEMAIGQRPVWPTGPEAAPESERSGHA
jgi:hypothetical protein